MLVSFVLSMAVAAPVPVAPPAPATTGPIPTLLEVKAGANGKVMVTVVRTTMEKITVGQGNAINPNGAAPAVITKEVPVQKMMVVELGEVKDLKITTADGKKVEVADAAMKLKDGGVVVVSADGKSINPNYLKLFKDDVLVLVSPELNAQPALTPVNPFPGGIRPRPPIQIQPLPAQPGIVLPAQPGVIQIQIQPGQVQILPAPVPAPEK